MKLRQSWNLSGWIARTLFAIRIALLHHGLGTLMRPEAGANSE